MSQPTGPDHVAAVRLKLVIARAQREARGGLVEERVVACLLAGAIVESTLRLALQRESGRHVPQDIGQLHKDHPGLVSARPAERAWRARIGVQHGDLLPGPDDVRQLVQGVCDYAAEVLQAVRGISLDSIGMADLVPIEMVQTALRRAESSLAREDLFAAAGWLGRALFRVRIFMSSSLSSPQVQRSPWGLRDVQRVFENQTRLLSDAARWPGEVEKRLNDLEANIYLGIAPVEMARLTSLVPHAYWTIPGIEHLAGSTTASSAADLLWASETIANAAIRIAAATAPDSPAWQLAPTRLVPEAASEE